MQLSKTHLGTDFLGNLTGQLVDIVAANYKNA
jgi:hypothetical protein